MSGQDLSGGVAAVILAAGSSSRMGSPKQTLQFQGTSLLRRAALAALNAGCQPVIVVTGANAELARRELAELEVQEVWNAGWETGMGSSVRTGIEALLATNPRVEAAAFLLCDQPHVTNEVLSNLINLIRMTGKPVIASAYGGSFGVPAVFGSPTFADLAKLDGVAGAKKVIQQYASKAHFVPFEAGAVDVDTPEDFLRLTKENS